MIKRLSIRMVKMKTNKGTKLGNKYFKSYKEQYEHDYRIEKMDQDYLKRPNETNKDYKFIKNIDAANVNQYWEKLRTAHKKKVNKNIQTQTKPTLNFLLSFSKDFDLSIEDREKQFQSVKRFIENNFSFPIYLIQHNDEKALHYSFSIFNYCKKTNRPLAKQINTSKLQDLIAEHLKADNQDYGHIRGEAKTISRKEHKSILSAKNEEMEQVIKEKEELIEQMKNKIKSQEQIISQKEDLIQQLNKSYNNTKAEMITEISSMYDDIIELYKEEDINKFIKMTKRYFKNDKQDKLNKFMDKWKGKINKIKNEKVNKITNSKNNTF